MTTLAEIEAHYARMDVPPLPSSSSLPVDVINPGTSRPENHLSPGLPSIDQTKSVTIASASANSSDGQEQRLDLSPLQGGVTVLEVPRLSPNASDGQFQSKNLKQIDQGTSSSASKAHLPVDVSVANQNLHLPPLGRTEERPPAHDVKAGDSRQGGAPTSVMIR
jgi:hypothetical protein